MAGGAEGGSDHARWWHTARLPSPWEERNLLIALCIPPRSTVVDIGCGSQSLSDHLPDGCTYVPVDVVPRPGVIVCDLNRGELPSIPQPVDFAVLSGVVEYLADPQWILPAVADLADRLLMTYVPFGGPDTEATRSKRGWRNHLTPDDLERLGESAGLQLVQLDAWKEHRLYLGQAPGRTDLSPLRQVAPESETDWARGYRALEAFVAREGHALIPPRHVEDGVPLWSWMLRQRLGRARGLLNPRRDSQLRRFDGAEWSDDDLRWLRAFGQLRDADPTKRARNDLLRWIKRQRTEYAAGRLTPPRAALLASLPGWTWATDS